MAIFMQHAVRHKASGLFINIDNNFVLPVNRLELATLADNGQLIIQEALKLIKEAMEEYATVHLLNILKVAPETQLITSDFEVVEVSVILTEGNVVAF